MRERELTEAPLGGASMCDRAVAELHDQQQQGKLPGTFFGRLCELACLSNSAAAAAVNAVLTERCDLVSITGCTPSCQALTAPVAELCCTFHAMPCEVQAKTFVVSGRETALAVVSHFRKRQAGVVKCLIAAELHAADKRWASRSLMHMSVTWCAVTYALVTCIYSPDLPTSTGHLSSLL